ncbi:IS110 family transposase [bacterium NHP-B]|nr:IS110 family transposase [bacterium NHP-B]
MNKDFSLHRVHTFAFYGFAKSLTLHKNDRIDAYKLAYYGKVMEKKPNMYPEDLALRALVKRREYLVQQLSDEKRHQKQTHDGAMILNIQDHQRYLENSIQALEVLIEAHLQKNTQLQEKCSRLMSVPGIGKTIAAKLLVTLPELGDATYTLSTLAALVGLAPYGRDSGDFQGKRFIRGGRKIPRDALYMAVLTGFHKIPLLKNLKERLLQKGKPCKVALVACMRKLLAIIHSILKRKVCFA